MADAEQTPQQPDEVANQGTIHERIARVYGRLQMLEREGHMRSKQANYDYATIDQLREALRPELAREGVTMVPHKMRLRRSETIERERTGDRGTYTTTQFDTVLHVVWRLACGDGLERGATFIDVPSFGRSLNSSDKDFNTALTYAERNAILAVFHLSSGEDVEQERPTVEGRRTEQRRTGPPQGTGQDQPYTPAPTAQAHPPVPEQLEQVKGIRAAMVAAGVYPTGERVTERDVNAWIKNHAERSIGRGVSELNRDEFQALLENLALQAGKLVPGFSFNAESGEVAWDAEKPQEASGAAGDQNPAEPVEGPPAAAEAPSAPVSPASPEAQQAIEEQAAQAKAGADPDNPPMSAYEHYIVHAQSEGVGEEAVIAAMLAAGAGKPEDLERQDVAQAFEVELQKVINAAKEAGS